MSAFLQIFGALAAAAGLIAGILWLQLTPAQRRLFPVQRLRAITWRGGEILWTCLNYFFSIWMALQPGNRPGEQRA